VLVYVLASRTDLPRTYTQTYIHKESTHQFASCVIFFCSGDTGVSHRTLMSVPESRLKGYINTIKLELLFTVRSISLILVILWNLFQANHFSIVLSISLITITILRCLNEIFYCSTVVEISCSQLSVVLVLFFFTVESF